MRLFGNIIGVFEGQTFALKRFDCITLTFTGKRPYRKERAKPAVKKIPNAHIPKDSESGLLFENLNFPEELNSENYPPEAFDYEVQDEPPEDFEGYGGHFLDSDTKENLAKVQVKLEPPNCDSEENAEKITNNSGRKRKTKGIALQEDGKH